MGRKDESHGFYKELVYKGTRMVLRGGRGSDAPKLPDVTKDKLFFRLSKFYDLLSKK